MHDFPDAVVVPRIHHREVEMNVNQNENDKNEIKMWLINILGYEFGKYHLNSVERGYDSVGFTLQSKSVESLRIIKLHCYTRCMRLLCSNINVCVID